MTIKYVQINNTSLVAGLAKVTWLRHYYNQGLSIAKVYWLCHYYSKTCKPPLWWGTLNIPKAARTAGVTLSAFKCSIIVDSVYIYYCYNFNIEV